MDITAVKAEMKPYIFSNTPVNCKQYYLHMVDNKPQQGFFGIGTDFKPFEGKVIHISEIAILVKLSRNKFCAVDQSLVTVMPSIGDKIKVTPYARRHFDGKRTDAPIIEKTVMADGSVVEWERTIIGSVKTTLPLPCEQLKCPELQEMISQIENLHAPDGHRTIAQMLNDAGAKNFDLVDPTPSNIIKTPPRLRFTVENQKHSGQVDVIYDRGMDYYRIELIKDRTIIKSISDLSFIDLGNALCDAIDDGSWNKIEVEILKSSNKRKLH